MRFPPAPAILQALSTWNSTATTARFVPALVVPPHRSVSGISGNQSMSLFSRLFHTPAPTRDMSYPVQKSADEWRAVLSPQQFRVLREQGTEPPFTGKYDKHHPDPASSSTYNCVGCSAPLYKAQHKFKSGCGWPAFFDAIPGAVTRHTDRTLGMERTEIVCSNCGGHLGHVFKGEGYATPTDERHCVNSISIDFGDGKGGGAKV